MKVQEVSLVDLAANLRKWILLKRAEMTKNADTSKERAGRSGAVAVSNPDDETKKQEPIALPGQVKANLTGTLADALEKLGALAEMVGAATIDDAAPVPPMVPELLTQCAALLTGAAEQLAAPAPETEPPPAPEAGPPAAEPMEEAAKDADGDDVAKADELGAEAEKALEKARGIIAKAGAKMARRRLREMKQHVDGLVKLLLELGDSDGVKKAASEQPDFLAELRAELDHVKASITELGGELKNGLEAVRKAVSEDTAKAQAIEKATEARIDDIASALKGPGPSNLGSDPGGATAPRRRSLGHCVDMAAEVQKRQRERR